MVSAPPGAEATVIARAAGTIKRINKRLGDAVRAGEIIATVDSLEATRMTAMRKSAISKLELAKKVFARESLLYEKGVSPRQDLEAAQSALAVAEAEAAEAQTLAQASNIASDGRSIAVISPADGKITTESTTIGAFVQPETPLFTIANEKQIQINAFITTQDLARVKVGDSATIMSRSDQEYRAKVRSITPAVSGTNQTATAVLELDDKGAALVIGEGVQVRLHTSNALTNSLIVPEDAIQNIEGRDVVFVKTKTGFKPQLVVVGQRSNGYAEIMSGLDPTTSIATQNVFLIKAEMIKNAPEED
jgi:cobalt-zinc-cadmium efflux system membrane fusion protein